MAQLVNRNSSRLECVYYVIKAGYAKYGTHTAFNMKDLKYDEEDKYNTLEYCQLLEDGFIKYCPFLENPLDQSKCYATQSIKKDTQKGKSVSDVVRTLEGIGFVIPEGKKFRITEKGEQWILSEIGTPKWQKLIDEGVLSYGPFVGFLHRIKDLNEENFVVSSVYLGYPNTKESVEIKNENSYKYIELSIGSTSDSVTRTRSKMVSWAITSGLLLPIDGEESVDTPPHIAQRDFVNRKAINVRKFKITEKFNEVIQRKLYVDNPLSYNNLLKEVKALRENGMEEKRKATLESENVIENRRFVIVDILNRASKEKRSVSYTKLSTEMINKAEAFFAERNTSNYDGILQEELEISYICGIPYSLIEVENDVMIKPLTIVNDEILRAGATNEALELSETIWKKVSN